MKKILRILNLEVFKNLMKMMTGTVLGQIISVVMVPIALRLYGAKMYGDLAVLTATASVVASFLGFGLSSAIMVEKTDEEAEGTYKFTVYSTNCLIIIVTLILILFSNRIKIMHTSLQYNITITLLAIIVITTNEANMLDAWLNRKGRFNILLTNPIISSMVNNGLLVLLGILGYTNIGLYVGLITSQFVTIIHMYIHMDKMKYKLKFKDIKKIISRNKDFIIYQYPASLLNSVVSNLPVQILSNCFNNTIVGYYSMSMKFLNIPAGLLGNTVNRVYFKEAADKDKKNECARTYTLKVVKMVTLCFMIPVLCILFLGEWLIPLLLGQKWVEAIPYLKIMCIWGIFAIGIICTGGFPSIIGRQKINMIVASIKMISFPILMITISYIFHNPQITVASYSILYSLINIIYYNVLFNGNKSLNNKFLYFCLKISCFIIPVFTLTGIVFKK